MRPLPLKTPPGATLTPRNQVPVYRLYRMSADTLAEIDTLFETCDAEFNSCRMKYERFMQMARDMKSFTRTLANYFRPYVVQVAARDGLNRVRDDGWACGLVALHLAKLWVEKHEAEKRLGNVT